MQNNKFKIVSEYEPGGDQPKVIEGIISSLQKNTRDQIILGVTGSGKTFSMANIIEKLQKPALIMAHNKTLAAQLYHEMKGFFPENAVEYFVSYYDYYQPEAYIPKTDTYIEKDSSINEQIDLLRHSATRSLLERRDVIVIASISCIYGLGAPELYSKMTINIEVGKRFSRSKLINQLVTLQYSRNDIALTRGQFRVRGDSIDVIPSHSSDYAWKIAFFGDDIESIHEFDPLTGHKRKKISQIAIYANSHFVTPEAQLEKAIIAIVQEADIVIKNFEQEGKLLEAQRLAQRIKYDVEMLKETGLCKGIENYSRHLTGRDQGQPPPTLFEYLPNDSLLFIDESHVTVPQINGMYNGDRSRKMTLVDYGFRLPSALDNRPLKFEEWDQMRSNTVYVSATPGKYELGLTDGMYHEQLIRPTGLLDPICMIRPVSTQIDDLLHECKLAKAKDERVMVTTLTKKMAEDLSAYMHEAGISVTYLHSEILTLERVEILNSLRTGEIDVLIGVNLLREGLDIPQVALVAILDADKEGFLRSETSLIQTIGRAARNVNGRVILYADVMTKSLTKAISETERRRKLQDDFNKANNITPTQILKTVNYEFKMLKEVQEKTSDTSVRMSAADLLKQIERKKKDMIRYATDLEFEKAASLRDEIKILENTLLQL